MNRLLPRLLMSGASSIVLLAQLGPSPGSTGNSRAVQLPASGRTAQGGVAVGQSPALGTATGSVNILNPTVQVQGPYQGSIPSSDPIATEPLTLAEAVKRGLQYNLAPVTAAVAQRQARAQLTASRAQLLPDITGDLRETVQQTNLAAAGLRLGAFPSAPGVPPVSFPTIVGPFNYFDLRASFSQNVLDKTLLHNYRASKENARAVELSARDTRELVVLAVTGAYLQLAASQSRVEAVRAQIATAQATHQQAVDRNRSGLNARIDVNRTQVELQTQQQRLNALMNDLAKQRLALARLIGLPMSQGFTLAAAMPFNPADPVDTVDSLIDQSKRQRLDLQSSEAQIRAAEQARRAAGSEYLPSLALNADYGAIGINPAQAHGTFSVSGTLRFPIWRSGRIRADVEQAEAVLAQRRAEHQDTIARVEQEVRAAQLDLATAAEQVKLAESSRVLANDTLRQARDRFGAGVADTVELVQAQETVAAAEQDYVSAVFSYQLARIGIARAIGQAEKSLK